MEPGEIDRQIDAVVQLGKDLRGITRLSDAVPPPSRVRLPGAYLYVMAAICMGLSLWSVTAYFVSRQHWRHDRARTEKAIRDLRAEDLRTAGCRRR